MRWNGADCCRRKRTTIPIIMATTRKDTVVVVSDSNSLFEMRINIMLRLLKVILNRFVTLQRCLHRSHHLLSTCMLSLPHVLWLLHAQFLAALSFVRCSFLLNVSKRLSLAICANLAERFPFNKYVVFLHGSLITITLHIVIACVYPDPRWWRFLTAAPTTHLFTTTHFSSLSITLFLLLRSAFNSSHGQPSDPHATHVLSHARTSTPQGRR